MTAGMGSATGNMKQETALVWSSQQGEETLVEMSVGTLHVASTILQGWDSTASQFSSTHPSLISSRRPNLNAILRTQTLMYQTFPTPPQPTMQWRRKGADVNWSGMAAVFQSWRSISRLMRRSDCCSFPSSIPFTLFSLHFVHTLAAKHDRQRPRRLSQSRPRRRRQLLLCKGRQSCCCGRRCR